jgi:hypothetical protein
MLLIQLRIGCARLAGWPGVGVRHVRVRAARDQLHVQQQDDQGRDLLRRVLQDGDTHLAHSHKDDQIYFTSHCASHAGAGEDDVPQLRQDREPGQHVVQEQAGGGRAALPALQQEGGTCTHVARTPRPLKCE